MRETPRFNVGVNPFAEPGLAGIPAAARPTLPTVAPPTPTPGNTTPSVSTRATNAPGEKDTQHFTITFRGTDELTRAIAAAASQSYNKTLHGNG